MLDSTLEYSILLSIELKALNMFCKSRNTVKIIFLVSSVISTLVVAQATLPGKLSGRWTTPNGGSGQSISATIDQANSKGTLTVWSSFAQCNIKDAPIAVTADGDKLTFKVDPSYSNPCRSDVSVELVKKSGSNEYEGELRQGGPSAAQFPML